MRYVSDHSGTRSNFSPRRGSIWSLFSRKKAAFSAAAPERSFSVGKRSVSAALFGFCDLFAHRGAV